MALHVTARLAANCEKTAERAAWLNRLPDAVRDLERRWALAEPRNDWSSRSFAIARAIARHLR
jgi:hypothetical protein